MTNHCGLRERKKAATKLALGQAAVRLAGERGLAGATAEAIAAEVGVSTRTFHNYFAAKEEAILYCAESDIQDWVRTLRERPAGEPIWESLEYVAIGFLSDPGRDPAEMAVVGRLMEESPALMARSHRLGESVGRELGLVIAERTGTDVDRDLYPNLLQMAVGCAVKTALELALHGDRTPVELVTEAFAQIRAGLPQPLV